jgi:uncharacterized membrane protein (UPF0127 family)
MRNDAMKNRSWLLVGAAIAAIASAAASAAEPAGYLRDFRRGHAILDTARGCIFLDVYFAESTEQRRQGLMRIRQLGEFESMIFISNPPIVEVMWMQNTYIPLDMIFLREGGRVAGVTENARPLSEELIRSPGPVAAVLEVNGGFAARFRVRAGDKFTLLN